MPHVSRTYEQQQHVSHSEAEFNFGILYRTIEEHINAFAAQVGPPYSVADTTERLGELLRTKAKGLRQAFRATELLSEMRENGAATGQGAGYRAGWETRSQVHVRSRASEALNGDRRSDYGKPQPQNVDLHERLRKMLQAGMSRNDMSKATGMAISALSYHIRHYNLDGGSATRPKRDEPKDLERIEQIRKMLGSGMTRQDVGAAIGISKDGVGYYVRKYKMEEPVVVDHAGNRVEVRKRKAYTRSKPHWTQMPKNRAKMRRISALGRKAWIAKAKEKKETA